MVNKNTAEKFFSFLKPGKPRSKGLSSSHPVPRDERRDPGNEFEPWAYPDCGLFENPRRGTPPSLVHLIENTGSVKVTAVKFGG